MGFRNVFLLAASQALGISQGFPWWCWWAASWAPSWRLRPPFHRASHGDGDRCGALHHPGRAADAAHRAAGGLHRLGAGRQPGTDAGGLCRRTRAPSRCCACQPSGSAPTAPSCSSTASRRPRAWRPSGRPGRSRLCCWAGSWRASWVRSWPAASAIGCPPVYMWVRSPEWRACTFWQPSPCSSSASRRLC